MTELNEKEIRSIAKEEAYKVHKEVLKEIGEIKITLSRLERLLLGEIGTDESDTLKARANYACAYAKRNTELKIIDRAVPALNWFEDMNTPDKGCTESKFDILGKIINAWTSGKWFLGIFGVLNVSTLIGLVILIFNFIKLVKDIS